ncbi:MAG: DNA repair protein RecO [candidate division WOR-3 bacterium]
MTNIVRDESLILRTRRFKDTSLVVIAFGCKRGKLKLIARGARRPRSTFGSSLEPFTRVRIIYYHRPHKEIYNLSETEIIDDFSEIRTSPCKIITALTLCEFLDQTLPPEQPNPRVYRLALQTIRMIEQSKSLIHLKSLIYSYLLITTGLLGYRPELNICVRCLKKPSNLFSIKYGGLVCSADADQSSIRLTGSAIDLLKRLYFRQQPQVDIPQLELFDKLVQSYIQYHFEGLELKALKFLQNEKLIAI